MDGEGITESVKNIAEIMERMESGKARSVKSILDDYDELRHETKQLAQAGAFKSGPYKPVSELVGKFIGDFHNNIKMLVTSVYNDAQKDFSEAKTAEDKRVVVCAAANELERITEHPEHRDHPFLLMVLATLREWESKLEVDPGVAEFQRIKATVNSTAKDNQLRHLSKTQNDERCTASAASHQQDDSEPVLRANGLNGQIVLSENTVSIRRDGFFAFSTFGLRGRKEILISSITSVQFREAIPFLVRGYIQFAFLGSQDAKKGEFQAAKDENTVFFTPAQQDSFKRIKTEIVRRMAATQRPEATEHSSEADEIEKLAALRDRGVITEDEFQHKKRQILGL